MLKNGMKYLVALILSATVHLGIQLPVQAVLPEISVFIGDQKMAFDQAPVIMNNRVMVPLRKIFESLEAQVSWEPDHQMISATKEGRRIVLQIDGEIASVDHALEKLDAPAKLINGRTLVPLRFVAESLGVQVEWQADSRRVVIKNEPSLNLVKKSYKNDAARVDCEYFQLEGYPNKTVETKLNQWIREQTEQVAKEYVAELDEEILQKLKDGELFTYFKVWPVSYAHHERILSITHIQEYSGAYPYDVVVTLNVDLETGEKIDLKKNIKSDVNFEKAMNEKVKKYGLVIGMLTSGELKPYADLKKNTTDAWVNSTLDNVSPTTDAWCFQDTYLVFTTQVPNALGDFIEVYLPYVQIADIVEPSSPMGRTFFDMPSKTLLYNPSEMQLQDVAKLQTLLDSYEKTFIEAVNTGDFAKVEASLVKGSALYNDQIKLVPDLKKKGITENLVGYRLDGIYYDQESDSYKLYVHEKIGITAAGKYSKKEFDWCYTAQRENDLLKLSKIEGIE